MVFIGGRRGDQSSPTEFLRELQVINCQWGGGGGGGGRGHKNTTELTGGSGKFYYDKTKILRPLSP